MTITCCQLYHDALRQPRIAIRYSDGTEEDRAPTPSELHLLKRTPTEGVTIPLPLAQALADGADSLPVWELRGLLERVAPVSPLERK